MNSRTQTAPWNAAAAVKTSLMKLSRAPGGAAARAAICGGEGGEEEGTRPPDHPAEKALPRRDVVPRADQAADAEADTDEDEGQGDRAADADHRGDAVGLQPGERVERQVAHLIGRVQQVGGDRRHAGRRGGGGVGHDGPTVAGGTGDAA